jgi:hypothetical protein
MGAPIGRIVLATKERRPRADIENRRYERGATKATSRGNGIQVPQFLSAFSEALDACDAVRSSTTI